MKLRQRGEVLDAAVAEYDTPRVEVLEFGEVRQHLEPVVRHLGVWDREDAEVSKASSVAILDFPNWFRTVGLGLSLRANCGSDGGSLDVAWCCVHELGHGGHRDSATPSTYPSFKATITHGLRTPSL